MLKISCISIAISFVIKCDRKQPLTRKPPSLYPTVPTSKTAARHKTQHQKPTPCKEAHRLEAPRAPRLRVLTGSSRGRERTAPGEQGWGRWGGAKRPPPLDRRPPATPSPPRASLKLQGKDNFPGPQASLLDLLFPTYKRKPHRNLTASSHRQSSRADFWRLMM